MREVEPDWFLPPGGRPYPLGACPYPMAGGPQFSRHVFPSILDSSGADVRVFSLCKFYMWTFFCYYSDNPLQK